MYNEEATEHKIKQIANDYHIVHFATHGVFNTTYSVLSGLLLAVDQDSIEDGFLQAYEIAQTELNANLVVLSGCETGITDLETGNGIASLARSFMHAKTPALVATLWRTKSGVTADLMTLFYAKLAEGLPKDIALQQAKIDYINQNPDAHLSDWVHLIQMGNTNALKIKKRFRLDPLGKGGFVIWCICCFLLALWYWKR